MTRRWEEIEDHTADMGIKVWADTFQELLETACFAFSELTTSVGAIPVDQTHSIVIEADDYDILLRDVLHELLYLLDVEDFIMLSMFKPQYVWSLETIVFACDFIGGTFVPGVHESRAEIKAVTYQDLSVHKIEYGWYGQVIFDI